MARSRLKPFVSLKRLRLGFLFLGSLLLVGLLSLSVAVQSRLDEARHEREEMVASRVFDELERELTAFLDGESERSTYLSLEKTDPSAWAPFVLGYFIREGKGIDMIAADGATSENRRRVLWALDKSLPLMSARNSGKEEGEPSSMQEVPEELGGRDEEIEKAKPKQRRSRGSRSRPTSAPKSLRAKSAAPAKEAPPAPIQAESTSESEIIQQLNRAPARRKSSKKSKAKQKSSAEKKDHFLDYTESY